MPDRSAPPAPVMTRKRLLIKDKSVVAFADEVMDSVDDKSAFRVSEIVPRDDVLRFVFRIIRWTFGDDSRMADWTRRWRCVWQLTVFHSEETKLFRFRADAIEYEKRVIWRSLLETDDLHLAAGCRT